MGVQMLIHEARLSERRAVLLRVAGELRAEASREDERNLPGYGGVLLRGLATKYEREAAEVK